MTFLLRTCAGNALKMFRTMFWEIYKAFPINSLLFMPDIIFYRPVLLLLHRDYRYGIEIGRSNKNEFFLQPHSPASSNRTTLSSRNEIKVLALCQSLFMFDSLFTQQARPAVGLGRQRPLCAPLHQRHPGGPPRPRRSRRADLLVFFATSVRARARRH